MTDLCGLLTDICRLLESCPGIEDELGAKGCVTPYIDETTGEQNSLERTVYRQPNGNILVAWRASAIEEGEIGGWAHRIEMYVRAVKEQPPLRLLNAIIDGIPRGEEVRWRYLCVNQDVDPVVIEEVVRLPDEEGIDYYIIRVLFREKADTPYNV